MTSSLDHTTTPTTTMGSKNKSKSKQPKWEPICSGNRKGDNVDREQPQRPPMVQVLVEHRALHL